MVKKDLVKEFNEIKEKLRPQHKFRGGSVFEYALHGHAFSVLLKDANKKTILEALDGIAKNKFAQTAKQREAEGGALKDIIRDNIYDEEIVAKSFDAMKAMLNSARKSIKQADTEKAVSAVNSMQSIPDAIADLYDSYPKLLGKQTDTVYDTYKKMMNEYSLSGLYNDGVHQNYQDVENYFCGKDAYKEVKEIKAINEQENAAWETKEQIDAAKQRIYNKFTKKEIAEYEQSHAEQIKSEDAKYTAELKEFVKEHENRERSKEHQKQIDEIKLKHNDKLLEAAYENFKDVARKPKEDDKSEKPASNDVPKRAVYVGRGKPRQ